MHVTDGGVPVADNSSEWRLLLLLLCCPVCCRAPLDGVSEQGDELL
jgi:hypothetical protein